MPTLQPTRLLSRILAIDVATSAAAGLLLALGAGHTADLLGLPVPFQQAAGLILLAFAGFVAWVAAQARPARGAVLAIIAVNAAWAVASAAVLLAGLVTPTGLGLAFVAVQAAAVAVVAEIQVIGLRRSAAAAPHP